MLDLYSRRLLRALARIAGYTRDSVLVRSPSPVLMADDEASQLIAAKIRDGGPWFCGRLGTPECNAVLNSLEIEWSHSDRFFFRIAAIALGLRREWDENVVAMLCNNVGLFPEHEDVAARFCRLYAEVVGQADALGYWGIVPGESYLIRKFAPQAKTFAATVVEPYLNAEAPWSAALQGKRVLVVNPFADSIESQYRHRAKLFPGTNVLPEFTLRTLRAVQSLAGTQVPYRDWFEALAAMKQQMNLAEFDVCLVGAGAYSVPLCAHAKELGKVAIYIGGALQILFGVRGRRWDAMPHINRFYNEFWVRPSEKEQIKDAAKIEGGCYW